MTKASSVSAQFLVIAFMAVLFTIVLQFRQIDDTDICWQIQLGEIILENGEFVRKDLFSFTHAGATVPTIGWLAQIGFALVYRWGGWFGLQLVGSALFAMAFAYAAYAALDLARQRGQDIHPQALAAAMSMGWLTALTNAGIRPQLVALLGCTLIMHMILRGSGSGYLRFVVVLVVGLIWQNSHPSLIVAGLITATAFACSLMGRVSVSSDRSDSPVTLAGLGLLIGMMMISTPEGLGIFQLSRENLRISRDVLGASEWLPIWSGGFGNALLFFWVNLAISLLLILRLRNRVRLVELLLFMALTALSFYAVRMTLFWSVVMVPLWSRWIHNAYFPASQPVEGIQPRFAWPTLLILFVIAVIGPQLSKQRLDIQKFHVGMAFEGVEALKQHVPSGNIYNNREYCGALILEGYPQWRVRIDGRLYLYSQQDWEDYRREGRGEVELAELIEQFEIQGFLLCKPKQRLLIEQVQNSADWRRVFEDGYTVAFAKSP